MNRRPSRVVSSGELRLRKFTNGEEPIHQDSLNTTTGRPYLEWNSCLGVRSDVWAMVTTAIAFCPCCRLNRTYDAHKQHLTPDGNCTDPYMDISEESNEYEEKQVISLRLKLDKGKGKAGSRVKFLL